MWPNGKLQELKRNVPVESFSEFNKFNFPIKMLLVYKFNKYKKIISKNCCFNPKTTPWGPDAP